ncbi:DegV family protein [Streptococcus cameli]
MKLAVITDSSAVLSSSVVAEENLYVLDIPVIIEGTSYVEGKNLTEQEFYEKMAASYELPKTSQPSLAELESTLQYLAQNGYTHVIGLFLAAGISGFYQNIQFLKDEFPNLTIAFPDSKITSAPLGIMVENTINWYKAGVSFDAILEKLDYQIAHTSAFILVDDLNHLVKGGRLSNGAALLGNLLSIKPILYFSDQGKIEVYEKVRTEKKAVKRLVELLKKETGQDSFQLLILHSNALEKAHSFKELLQENGIRDELPIVSLGAVIGTHLGSGGIAFGYTPIMDRE